MKKQTVDETDTCTVPIRKKEMIKDMKKLKKWQSWWNGWDGRDIKNRHRQSSTLFGKKYSEVI